MSSPPPDSRRENAFPAARDGPPERVIRSRAPIRICDLGGWTDTWFAGHGRVLNLAVSPVVEVQLSIYPAGARPHRLLIDARNFGDRYVREPGSTDWDRHPLIEAAFEQVGLPAGVSLEAAIHSLAPPGASTGTSAASLVALLGALLSLNGQAPEPGAVARLAHAVETDLLGWQSGVQDQVCAAYGGVNAIEIEPYPRFRVHQLQLPPPLLESLERQLLLFYLGRSHRSSKVHEAVIEQLSGAGPHAPQLEALREAARSGRLALEAGDLAAFGQAMIANTAAQQALHPALVSGETRAVIEIARRQGALGWKVNGAGGSGGSLTVLCGPDRAAGEQLIRAVQDHDSRIWWIPIAISAAGLQVWDERPGSD